MPHSSEGRLCFCVQLTFSFQRGFLKAAGTLRLLSNGRKEEVVEYSLLCFEVVSLVIC